MSKIHYFQRYSQKENMVTNNTLLLMSRLYNESPEKFRIFINTILEDNNIELETMVKFKQQQKSTGGSIPDGCIEQESFKIVIETKLYGQEGIKQIERHLGDFNNEDKQIFLWINKEPIDGLYKSEIEEILKKANSSPDRNIEFASITFKEICSIFEGLFEVYDHEMRSLIEDYEKFCIESNLINNLDDKIRVVLAGKTLEQNFENQLYYMPMDRGYQNTKYLGLYKNKAVRGIGEVEAIFDVKYDPNKNDLIVINQIKGKINDDYREKMFNTIIQANKKFGYRVDEERKYFFVKTFHVTNYKKPTKGGLMGTRYIDLQSVNGYHTDMSAKEIANHLTDKTWEIK